LDRPPLENGPPVGDGGRALVVTLHRPPDQFYEVLRRLIGTCAPDAAKRIDFVLDKHGEVDAECVAAYDRVSFFHQDPLEALYPEAYAYAVRLERACREAGTPLLSSPRALSGTTKSHQLTVLAQADIPVAPIRRLRHWREALDGAGVGFPLFLRYDSGHSPGGPGLAGPFASAAELERPGLPEVGGWPPSEDFEGLAALRWIDTSDERGLFRRYRAYVCGDTVIRGNLIVAQRWFAASSEEMTPHLPEMRDFIYGHPTAEERDLFLRVARALELGFCAIDYARRSDGSIIVWEANPHPVFPEPWASDEAHRERFVWALAKMLLSGRVGRG
jgi:hypothetical protein